jgi:UV excision repair protein RAD23
MKLVLKTLKQVPHDVEVSSGDCTVQELKIQTEKSHNIDHETIKLVFNGVVLKDENTLNSYNIHDGNTIIMMINKTKVLNKPIDEKKEEPKKVDINKQDDIVVEDNKDKQNLNNNTSSNNNNQHNLNNQQSQTNYSEQVKTLVEMGFPQEYSEAAIKAAKGNVSLAIEFLYNGIPSNIENQNNNSGNGNNSENLNNNNSGQSSNPTSSLDAVKRIAQIIKVLCANNPSHLQNIIQELSRSRPELISLIQQHENEFKAIIQSEVTEDDIKAFQDYSNELGLGEGSGQGQGQGQGRRENQIKLSKEEYDAIQRLKAYGFSELDCVQAYFAFDKNEEYALNFLFDMKNQDNFDDGNNKNNNDNK